METYQVNVTRDEQIADRIEFCLKQDISIGTLKQLMSLRIPYHPPASDIEILCNNLACPDDYPISFFLLDINKPIEFVFRDVRDWKYRHTFEDDKDVTKPYEIVGEDAVKKVDNEHSFEIRWRKCRILIQRGENVEEIPPEERRQILRRFVVNNLIFAVFSYYILFYTDTLTPLLKMLNSHLFFPIPVFVIWLIANVIYVIFPIASKLVLFSVEWRNKKNRKLDFVDFVPENIVGDAILCVYYFFATILPWNRGPRVFRD